MKLEKYMMAIIIPSWKVDFELINDWKVVNNKKDAIGNVMWKCENTDHATTHVVVVVVSLLSSSSVGTMLFSYV